jgi:hypothetical protein
MLEAAAAAAAEDTETAIRMVTDEDDTNDSDSESDNDSDYNSISFLNALGRGNSYIEILDFSNIHVRDDIPQALAAALRASTKD